MKPVVGSRPAQTSATAIVRLSVEEGRPASAEVADDRGWDLEGPLHRHFVRAGGDDSQSAARKQIGQSAADSGHVIGS
jgi:hypothetical protein